MSEVDREIMGTPVEAHAKLVAATQAWREFRQPRMDTAAGHKKHDAAEREAGFRLANAALLWLWHTENPAAAEESSAALEWRRDFTTLPEIGRKFIALYDDGSGAAMFWRHDGGFIDQDGDDHSAAKNWAASYSAWAYLPNDLEFWCEMLAEDAVILRLPAAPAEARSEQAEGEA